MAGVTRRALLAGGAVLLTGCGKDLPETPPLPSAEDAMGRQLEAEQALHAALEGVRGELVPRLAARSAARARRIAEAAGLTERGAAGAGGDPVQAARAALAAHVEALPSLARPPLRELGTDLVVGSAVDLAMLGAVLDRVTVEPFPGSPA